MAQRVSGRIRRDLHRLGLGAVNALGLDGEDLDGVLDAVDYIAAVRQAEDLSKLPVGRRVVVVGGGMTAIDIAVQSKLLGADEVTIVYRRGQAQMKASTYEQELAQTKGVQIRHWAKPARLMTEGGEVRGIEFERTREGADGRAEGTGATFAIEADVVFKAIGQAFETDGVSLDMRGGRIAVDAVRRTSLPGVWAGGDCVADGQDLTVSAVEDGKVAAMSIDGVLRAGSQAANAAAGAA